MASSGLYDLFTKAFSLTFIFVSTNYGIEAISAKNYIVLNVR